MQQTMLFNHNYNLFYFNYILLLLLLLLIIIIIIITIIIIVIVHNNHAPRRTGPGLQVVLPKGCCNCQAGICKLVT